MIGKLATGMARRGILKGALGLGAAVGLGGSGFAADVPTSAQRKVMARASSGALLDACGGMSPGDYPPEVKCLEDAYDAFRRRERYRPAIDGLDVDVAALRSPSPAWKLMTQRQRQIDRDNTSGSLWDIWSRAREAFEGNRR